jgi:hypothetical protein
MNERITKLARQAGFTDFPDDKNGVWITDGYWNEELERFAELVRQEEREACIKLLEDFSKTGMVPVKDTWRMGLIAGANAIRGRTQ